MGLKLKSLDSDSLKKTLMHNIKRGIGKPGQLFNKPKYYLLAEEWVS